MATIHKATVAVHLDADDIKVVLGEHARSLIGGGFRVKSIELGVNGHNQEGDWRGEYPLEYRLDSATVTLEKE